MHQLDDAVVAKLILLALRSHLSGESTREPTFSVNLPRTEEETVAWIIQMPGVFTIIEQERIYDEVWQGLAVAGLERVQSLFEELIRTDQSVENTIAVAFPDPFVESAEEVIVTAMMTYKNPDPPARHEGSEGLSLVEFRDQFKEQGGNVVLYDPPIWAQGRLRVTWELNALDLE